MIKIEEQWFLFYHRQTNRHSYSRQACAEPITIDEKGQIKQVEVTSIGLNVKPFSEKGKYYAYIACNLWSKEGTGRYDCIFPRWQFRKHPYFTLDNKESKPGVIQYIANMNNGSVAGFKYFQVRDITKIKVTIRGKAKGRFVITNDASFHNKIVTIPIDNSSKKVWKEYSIKAQFPNEKVALYFQWEGRGAIDFLSFDLI